MKVHMHEMNWVEVQEILTKTDCVIVPLGSLEEHGPQYPVGSCFILAQESARRVGERAGVPVCPTIPFGVSREFQNFPGTVTLRSETLKELVRDVCINLIRNGFRRIIFLSAHGGGNLPALTEISEELRERTGALFAVLHLWGLVTQLTPTVAPAPGLRTGHGGEPAASVILYLTPNLVDTRHVDIVPLEQPLEGMISQSSTIHEFKGVKTIVPLCADEISGMGIMGDPTKVSKDRGERLFKALVDYLCDFVQNFKTMKIPEYPEKRSPQR